MANDTRELLEALKAGEVSVDEALLRLKTAPFTDLGFAKVDTHRALRQGTAEVIYGAGKTPQQILQIAKALLAQGEKRVLITRLGAESAETLAAELELDYREAARIGIVGGLPKGGRGSIVVATGGTSDIPVAEEAALTAEFFGGSVTRLYDVGVAGLHRLLSHLDTLCSASVIVAVAGMEGALASVIGGLADCPVIAVPTSVGYG
ncbi:MAG: nickel pincer cofactor biosynthesis protein LarB, partial [Oscillospiraceae bacterium]|nr:nickel pincer cofactor biosynthesis protein LarB [Oscillospiraceae bacterium]